MTDTERARLISLVDRIMACEGTEEEVDEWIREFTASVPHPSPANLIFHMDLSSEEVVERALSYKALELGGS